MKQKAHPDTPVVESRLDRYVLEDERRARIPLDRSTIYRMRKAGTFPEPVRLGKRVLAWRESQLVEWADARTKAR